MSKKILISTIGLLAGSFIGFYLIFFTSFLPWKNNSSLFIFSPLPQKKEVIGFLPYWLLDKANHDYSKYITTLSYFSLRIDNNGNLLQDDPGWNDLDSGKLDDFFSSALKKDVNLSLLISNGDPDSIDALVGNPIPHAKNFVSNINPIIDKYKFSDINLDIEYTSTASPEAKTHFTQFVKEVRKDLKKSVTLTIEISTTDVIKNTLIDPKAVGQIADNIVLMAYDYHSSDSFVIGPIAPLNGAGTISEYDVTTAVEKALSYIPSQKLILGIPLYGYEWESLGSTPRSAAIPNTAVVASNKRVEDLLQSCSSCKVSTDSIAKENYISYFDQNSNDYHIIFYPNEDSTISKINLANNFHLKGIALWALGYEGNNILNPLENYKK